MDDCFYKTPSDSHSIKKFFDFNWYLKEHSKKLSQIKPYPRPDKDRASTLSSYKIQSKKCKDESNKSGCSMRSNFMYSKQNSCLKDINDLEPIHLKDMKVNSIHHGRYLECKTIAEPFYVAGMHLLVEDTHGDIENVCLYDYNFKSYEIDPNDLIPQGTKILIKEPNLKLFTNTKTEFGIRIDSPTDIIIREPVDQDKLSVEQSIKDGNSQFQKQNFHLSIVSYTNAILKSNKTNVRALLNRAQAYIKLEKNYLGFKDAELAAQLEISNEKAYFRMGRAAYQMHEFDKAKSHFEKCLTLNQENKEAKLELQKSNQRLAETRTGNYDFKSLLEQYLSKETHFFDIADYRSAKMAVVDIPNKCKGVIANEFIKKGELLVVCKAISASFKLKNTENFTIKTDLIRKRITNNDQCENFSNIVYRMQSDPGVAKEVYSLFAGPEYERNENAKETLIDVTRISAIQRFNAFTVKNAFECVEPRSDNSFVVESGLWVFPAMLNHSCISDTVILFLGDIMILYAKRDLKKGEEITNRYFQGDYAYRVESAKTYNFKCDCRLCMLDKDDLNLERRQVLLKEIRSRSSLSLNEAMEDVKRMRKLYANRSEYQFDLLLPLQNLAVKYRESLNFKKSASISEELYELNKERAFSVAIDSLKDAYNDYKILKKADKHKWCYDTAAAYFSNNDVFFERFWNRNG